MSDLVIIVPVHIFNDEVENLLKKAVASVPDGLEIRISCAHGLSGVIKEKFGSNKNIVLYEDEDENASSDFATLVNQAVGDSKMFSILEFDDEYTPIWLDNAKTYLDYRPDTSVLMCFEDLMDFNNKNYVGIGNDAPWASSFSNEIGYVDLDALQSYFDFYMTGAIFNTEDWEAIGGLKSSMKVTFWYEFLMRSAHFGKKIYIMPKVGYVHNMGRKDSLIEQYRGTISQEEGKFWFDTAKEEFYFKEDRNKTYSPESTKE